MSHVVSNNRKFIHGGKAEEKYDVLLAIIAVETRQVIFGVRHADLGTDANKRPCCRNTRRL